MQSSNERSRTQAAVLQDSDDKSFLKWQNCMGKNPAAVARAGDGEEADGRGAQGGGGGDCAGAETGPHFDCGSGHACHGRHLSKPIELSTKEGEF